MRELGPVNTFLLSLKKLGSILFFFFPFPERVVNNWYYFLVNFYEEFNLE